MSLASGYYYNLMSARGIIRTGLEVYLDPANTISYPGTGSAWYDLSGNSNDATLFNTPTFTSADGGALIFNGTNQYAQKSTLADIEVGSISMWIRPSTLIDSTVFGGTPLMLSLNSTDPDQFYISLGNTTGTLTNEVISLISVKSGTVKGTAVADGSSLAANTWVNIVFNWDIVASRYIIRVNDVTKTTVDSSVGKTPLLTNANILNIASLINSSTLANINFFNGRIGQVLVYSDTLNGTQLTENYNLIKGRYGL